LIEHLPEETFALNAGRWAGLEAVRYRDQPPNEVFAPSSTHHSLLLLLHAPKEFEARSEGIKRVVPPPPCSIPFGPAGSSAEVRWSSHSDSLHVFLEPGLVARVAAEEFDLDCAHVSLPPLDGLALPPLRGAMLAVNDELTTELAVSAGFADQSQLTQSFKRLVGVTPGQFRKSPKDEEGR
jgi:AraC-like DNA-binding protein